MRTFIVAMLAAIAIGFASAQPAAKSDLEKFQGTWQAFYIVSFGGKPASDDEVKDTSLLVEGNQFTLKTKDSVVKGTFTIDPSRTPKTIDVVLEGAKPDEKLLGIYRIDGDERTSCFAMLGKERPTQMDPKTADYLQFGWKRPAR